MSYDTLCIATTLGPEVSPVHEMSNDDMSTEMGDSDNSDNDGVDLKQSAALFILKTAESHNIPISAMETICTDITSLVELCVRESISEPFAELETSQKQTKYFRESLGLLVSVILIID